MPLNIELEQHRFVDGVALAEALATELAERIGAAIAERGRATLVLPGGNSPRRFLTRLGQSTLDWSRVTVTLTDERQVAAGNARSNARLLRETLFQGDASSAIFVPLYAQTDDDQFDFERVEANVAALALPFDAVVLGMGTDGHCASLFPDADRLAEALRADQTERVLPMLAQSAGEPRVTLTLAALVDTRALYLHIEGEAKRKVLDGILGGARAPVANVLSHARACPQIFWCP